MDRDANPYSPFGGRYSLSQRDCVDVPAIVRFGAMGRATETEKSRRVRIRAQPNILDLPDAGPREPRGDVAAEIELGMAVARAPDERTDRCRDPRRQNAQ